MRFSLILTSIILTFYSLNAQDKKDIDSLKIIISTSQNDSTIAHNYVRLGNLYRKATKPDSAMVYAKKSLDFALRSKNPQSIAYTYSFMGAIEYYRWNMGDAMNYYQKVDSVLTKNNIVNRRLFVSYADRAELFRRSKTQKNEEEIYDNAMFYYNKALEVAKELKDSSDIARTLMRMGSAQKSLLNLEEAKKYYKEVDSLYLDHVYKGTYHREYALLHLKLGDTAKFFHHSKLSYDIKSNSRYGFERAVGQKEYAYTLSLAKRYAEGIELGEKSSKFFNSIDPPDYGRLSGLYKTLASSNEAINKHEEAYKYLLLLEKTNDTLDARSKKKEGRELEKKYQTQKKEQEIALLKSQNELAEAQKKNQRNLMLGGLGLTTAAGIFLFLGYRNRKKTNDKLRELDKVKSNFFANISHEFRTPLSLISGPIEQQLQKTDISDQEKQNLEIAQRNSTRLVTLVDQLLDLSKLESGHFSLKVQEGNVSTFLKSLTSSFEFLAQENNQKYTTQISEGDTKIWFDTDVLEKIVTNLIGNAIKYSPAGENISILAAITNQKLQLEVKNSGAMLSPEVLPTLFNRFERVDETTAGTGIGLALTKELVTLHKGTIDVTSDTNWTTFTVLLPISQTTFTTTEIADTPAPEYTFSQAQSNTATPPATFEADELDIFSKNDKPILLIVDDNEDLRTYVSSLFNQSHTILTAINGKDGFEKALSEVPDLIITDLMMPEDDGITLTRNCKTTEATSHIPVVMLTAKAGDENQLLGLETGADSYITKPFNTEILKTTVRNLQETRNKLQERFSQEVVLLPKDIATNATDERFLTNLQEVMDKNLVESDFSSEAFADAVGMSRMQLHRKLKALTGLSATEFIRGQRLKLAAQMLKNSDINVSQVGYAVGFNNHSYFTKCFKEKYGISPSEYSKKS